ncbi:MAG: T9SS type A sorting domain-containing protein [Saprospiraceae bacterium]|uniref:T9SS type A sorting domain-containing protein n=1 Tax=Candidatus Opimibacter skivensis TaxID=2982028 RepID=A0A9D7SU69_9BACT|nr:T9SS type A sorting domain-containing protein [Candidatus Opimibacter skivensis]
MKIFFLAFGVLFQHLLQGQDNFSKYYTFDSGVSNFRTLLVDKDTILLEGIFVDTISPFLQGIAFAKVDSSGNLISYHRYFDTKGRDLTYPPLNNIIKLSDGRYLVPAMTLQDEALLLIFLNSQFFVDTVFEFFTAETSVRLNLVRSVFELNDGYIVFGSAQRLSYATDGQIFRITKNGDLLWRKWYGLTNKDEAFGDIAQYTDSTFILASFHKPFPVPSQNHLYNTWIFEVDSDGNILQEFVDPDPYSGPSGGLVIDKNNNIYYCGEQIIDAQHGQQNAQGRIGMLDTDFNLKWKLSFGKNISISTGLTDMISSDNKLISVGSYEDTSRTALGNPWGYMTGWTVLTTPLGDSKCERFDTATWFPMTNSSEGIFRTMDTLSSGNIIACGEGRFGEETEHNIYAWLVKMPNPPCKNLISKNEAPPENITSSLRISPNPARTQAVIQWSENTGRNADYLLVFAEDGKRKQKLNLANGSSETFLNLSGYLPGIYFVQLLSKGGYLLGVNKFTVSP